jgi:hypothetical protein
MADADVQITAGTGTKIDTRTVGAGTDEHRQVVVIGDPSTAAAVAPVTAADGLSVNLGTNNDVQGDVAHDSPDANNPVKVGGKALSAAPTAVAANDRVNAWFDLFGAQMMGVVPHSIGYTIATATAQYTSTQTSTVLGPTNGASTVMYVYSLQIQATGSTGGNIQVYYGTGAYSRGTSRALFDGNLIPSATFSPGVVITPPVPFVSVAGDECRVTTSAAINALTVTVWYYTVG